MNCLLTLPGLTAATTLKRKKVGVVAVATQAEIRPPDGIPLACVKDELRLCELHGPRTQLVALIIHIGDLAKGRKNKRNLNQTAEDGSAI